MAKHSKQMEDALQVIRECIAHHGAEAGPKIAKEVHFPGVPASTWHRWLSKLAVNPGKVAVVTARKAAAHLPTAPSPSYITEKPAESRKNIDFMARLESLYADAELLRAYAVTKGYDVDGNEQTKIKLPNYFSQSIKLRADLLEGAVKALQQVYDYQRIQHFHDLILAEIGKESPDCARRITERLAQLDQQHGITIDAQVVA